MKSIKPPLSLLPSAGIIHGAMACHAGATGEYKPYDWRKTPISYMEYLSAIERHRLALQDRQDLDASGVHHLGHIIAGASIMLDAMECGMLVDDRPVKGCAADMLARLKR